MATRRVFVISGAGLAAYHRHGSKLLDPFSFDADEEGLAQFAYYLERFPDDVTCVIVDVVEEEFREETVPHVVAWERRALLRSKAARTFPGARYLHWTRLGREPGGRRDDRVLFSAITRSEALAPWLAPMTQHEIPLAGIYSPAMLTGTMLKAVGAGGEHVLVVSRQAGGGLRQTCFRGGRLRFSRLAAMPRPAAGGHESHLLAEVERTRRYLSNLRSRAASDRLEVHVLSHGKPLDALRRELRRDAGGDFRSGCSLVDLATVARRLGLRRWGGESSADRLFVHLLARRPPPNHYATPDQTRRLAVRRTRLILNAASAALAAGACLFGGAVALEGTTASSHARALALQAALYERRYREAQATLPPAPATPVELEQVVSAVSALHGRRADPIDLLALIGDALAGFPRVRIEGIAWRTSDDPEAPIGPEDEARTGPRLSGPRPSGEEPRRGPKSWFQAVRFGARIEPFDGDHRAAIDTIRRLAAALTASPGVEHVRILTLPLELGSEHALTGAAETASETAAFEIRVTLRLTAPGGAGV